jgi:hypothetical protein
LRRRSAARISRAAPTFALITGEVCDAEAQSIKSGDPSGIHQYSQCVPPLAREPIVKKRDGAL